MPSKKNDPVGTNEAQDLRAYLQVKEGIDWLFSAVWDRWHPQNPRTQGQAPAAVYDALGDLRPIVGEASALWNHLGRVLHGDRLTRAQIKAMRDDEGASQ